MRLTQNGVHKTCRCVEGLVVARDEARAGFEVFFRAEYPNVYRAVFLATGNREVAEDAVQEAFERAFVRWRRLSRHDWAGGWVMTTALNASRKVLRRRSDLPLENGERTTAPVATNADLTAALRALPLRQRQAVLLFYLGDLHPHAIAEAMGISEGTVKAHLAQARSKLRELLGDDYV